MSNQPQRSLRLLPRNDFSKLTGSRGEIFYDSVNNTLRIFNGQSQGGEILATRTWVTGQLPSTAGLATQTYVNQAIAAESYVLRIASDDSTRLSVNRDETLQVRGQGMITTSISTDSTGIQLVITAPDVSNTDINVNQQSGSAAVIPTERVVKSYADLLFNIQTAQLQDGTLDITAASLNITQIGLGLPRGVPISEFSVDSEFVDNASDTVPTEAAVRGYIDRRLGLTHNGDVVQPVNKIGPTYLTAGAISGQLVSFHCERSGTGAIGQIMSFGNGTSASKGLRMPRPGRLILATMAGTGINGTVTVQAFLNGVANASYQLTQTNGSAADVGVTAEFANTPLQFAAGDTLGWYQASLPTASTAFNVNFYVVFD